MTAVFLAACVQDTETGKLEPDTTPAYTLVVSEPIGAVALDVGPDPGNETILDGVCVLDATGAVACCGDVPAPDPSSAFASISIALEGGCGVLVTGGASCWGNFADIATHDLSAVTTISVYDEHEVCAGDGVDAWCQADGMGVNDEWTGVDAVQIDAYLQGMAFQDAAGALFYSWNSDLYAVEPESPEPVVSWNGNAGISIVYVTADGRLAQSTLNRPELVGPEQHISNGVASASQTLAGGDFNNRCWIRTDGKIDFAWGEAFDDERYDPTLVEEDYQFVAVACAGKLEPWAITDDGRVARLVWESAPEMPF